ncbi:hypothetical protein I0Q91_05590 [Halanaerobiaceae bacterium Z-7014]|uniref:Uncharacterized protein n=1 Tax=Halonatronomonas betaini TaxID=2778430 RepID=A0A931F651_9FIRM|nr:hypothetical protein [Halonatronomonas betaini]MBF8436540.1 hypothetical protein [Halonatronomonas betaini]
MAEYNPKKYTDFSKKEIRDYLKNIKISIVKETYYIAINRDENKKFMEDYNLTTKKIEEIILRLSVDNFCYAADNVKEEYKHEILYVFCIDEVLNYFGEFLDVDIYIKFNLIRENEFLYIISFHKLQKPINFLFKE